MTTATYELSEDIRSKIRGAAERKAAEAPPLKPWQAVALRQVVKRNRAGPGAVRAAGPPQR